MARTLPLPPDMCAKKCLLVAMGSVAADIPVKLAKIVHIPLPCYAFHHAFRGGQEIMKIIVWQKRPEWGEMRESEGVSNHSTICFCLNKVHELPLNIAGRTVLVRGKYLNCPYAVRENGGASKITASYNQTPPYISALSPYDHAFLPNNPALPPYNHSGQVSTNHSSQIVGQDKGYTQSRCRSP